MKKGFVIRTLAFLLILLLSLSLIACKADPEKPAESKKPGASDVAPKEKRTFAIVYPVVHPFFDPVTESAENYVKTHEGFEILIKAPEHGNVQQQVEIVENLIAMKVDGIAIGSTDADALAPIIDKAVNSGIPVVTFDTDTPNCKRAGYIGTDNYKAGVHMAHVIAKHIGGEGEIIILQDVPTQLNLADRLKAIEETLAAEYPNIKLVDVQSGYADPAKSVDILETMIQANPNFASYSGMGAAGGPAGIAVWQSKGWTKEDKKIITFDNTPDNIDGLRNGVITALVSQNQHLWGEKIIESLNALCDGKPIEEYEDTGTTEITIENIDTYQN
jgi:ribose transport system substrate-binding protein